MFEWEEYFEPHILERGRNYARRGAVQHINKQGDIIEAVVAGSEYYKVKLRYDGHFFSESYCSCPYAAGGSFCKHMAAVLYETDAGNEENHVQEEKTYAFCNEKDGISIVDLISSADRSQLEGMLLELAASDYKVESRIRAGLAGVSGTSDLTEMKNEIDNIFYAYSGRGNYIDYYGAMSFESDLTTYLRNETNRLFDDGEFYTAFELSMYAYVKLGNWDIDDDGEIAMISSCCYEIWQKAAWNCSDLERTLIKEWFLEHSEDGTVIDYMEDVLQNFLRYELASKEELREEIRQLDVLIEESKGSNKCKSIYTSYYGYSIEAVEFRMILMKRLGADEEEIDDFRKKNMCFQSVRKYYIQKAQSEGNIEEEIRLLNESKRLDADSSYLVHSYSVRLIELYHLQNDFSREKAERKLDFLSYHPAGLDEFRCYRDMCSEDEWNKERVELIRSRTDADKRCELLAEEKMLPELYNEIFKQNKKLNLLNKYGFLLAEDYSEPILHEYRDYVSSVAEYARNRSSYDELIRYLKRMQKYIGGKNMVRNLCREWIAKYPTRKVMVQELQKMIL